MTATRQSGAQYSHLDLVNLWGVEIGLPSSYNGYYTDLVCQLQRFDSSCGHLANPVSLINPVRPIHAGLAQLEERSPCKGEAGGS